MVDFNKGDTGCIVACIVIIIISISCAVLVKTRPAAKTSLSKELEAPRFCLACALGAFSERQIEKLNKTEVDGVQMCCADTPEQLKIFLEMLRSNTDDKESLERLDAENLSLGSAHAHKKININHFKSHEDYPEFGDKNFKLEFDINGYNSFKQRAENVEVLTSAIVVQEAGFYVVYSSLFFRSGSNKPCKELEKQIWEHIILLTANNDEENSRTIFSTTHTCCDECKHDKRTSYAGGVFRLKENDRLHVEVSSDGVTRLDDTSSYLGLIMLK